MHEFVAACESNRRQLEAVTERSAGGGKRLSREDVAHLRAMLEDEVRKERSERRGA